MKSILARVALVFPLSLVVAAAWAAVAAQEQEGPPKVSLFTPQGIVKDVRQVRARFSADMVPFGDPRAARDPFEIDCGGEKSSSRWADTRNWILDFDRDLPAGVRCQFTLRPGLKTLSGAPLTGQSKFEFSTGGPAILQTTPWEGSEGIDESQIFVLRLDAPATIESVRRHVYFSVEGIVSQVGARIVDGDQRKEILRTLYQYRDQDSPDDVILLQARQTFPQEAVVRLVWGAGIQTASGVATQEDQTLVFKVRPAFTARFECSREAAERPCVPLTPMGIYFSAPVPREALQDAVLEAGGRQWKPKIEEGYGNWLYNFVFEGPFPENTAFKVRLPAGLKDESGRPLSNADRFPLTVRTGEFPPLAKFAADFGIIEANAEPALAVTLRNLEAELGASMLTAGPTSGVSGQVRRVEFSQVNDILEWIRRLRARSRDDREVSIFSDETLGASPVSRLTIPKPNGGKAFEVVGIPLPKPGFYMVELESDILGAALLGSPKKMYVPAAALVTNLAVHFKWGLESSLVWVTRLDTGEPVDNATIQVWDCHGKALAEASVNGDGVARFRDIPVRDQAPYCDYQVFGSGLVVTARSGDDFSFVHTSWNDGIEPWRFQVPQSYDAPPISAETVFDRPLFRAGETVHMKHVIRQQTLSGFAPFPQADLPDTLVISHSGSGQSFKQPLIWDDAGLASSEWSIPAAARLGHYSVTLAKFNKNGDQTSSYGAGSFRVEEYRVPLMKASIRPPSEDLVSPSNITVDVSASYLSGGPAADLPTLFRSQLQPTYGQSVAGFDGFVFANGEVQEETRRDEDAVEADSSRSIQRREITLDAAGSARVTVGDLPPLKRPMRLQLELEFKDPNGEIQTVSNNVPLWSSRRLVGIKPDSWALSKDSLKFQVAVVDLKKRPVGKAAVRVELFQTKTYSHRKRLVGGFYAYEHIEETKSHGVICEGSTDAKGLLFCDVKSPLSGQILLAASTEDEEGRASYAKASAWLRGDEDWWFAASDDDRMDVIPERPGYEPGETATFQVRMPFRAATALVTVEREGVSETYIRKLSGKAPVIQVPMLPNYAPNVFVSVLAVRGRVGDVQPTALVDLGKPAYRLGLAQVDVGWKAHELKVQVETDRQIYRVRETAHVSIAVSKADGKLPPAGSELAVAAVDEGLLELLPNTSWQLLANMMGRRGYGVETSTAQMQVVGKRHFGLKALPTGGGGGQQTTRELFDTLLFWKARVRLDSDGKASVDVPLNDSLTSFRIVAVATGGVDLFGTGDTSIRSTQDLMVFAGVPPLVREGDRLQAGFMVRNASERSMRVRVNAQVKPLSEKFKEQVVQLEPGQARDIAWEIMVPAGVAELVYEIDARDNTGFSDRLNVKQQVIPTTPVRTYQATLTQLEPDFQTTIAIPADAEKGRGGVRLDLDSTLLAGLDPVRSYMRWYPYGCLEQKTSKAIALNDLSAWNSLMANLGSYIDGEGLLKYFPTSRWGSDALTSYVLAISNERGWEIPDEYLGTIEEGLEGFVEGRVVRYSSLPTTDLALRKLAAIEALSRYGRAKVEQLASISIQPNLWPTSAVLDWLNVLNRVKDVPNAAQRQAEVEQILRSRLNFQGTVMGFSTDTSDFLWWLMVSNDVNAVRLTLSLLEAGLWREDLPRILVGALSRRKRGHWDLTTANAWGVLASEKFARAFEATPVAGTTQARLGSETKSFDWKGVEKGGALDFEWPAGKTALKVEHQGPGKPWLSMESRAAIPLKEPLSSGYKIKRSLQAIERKEEGKWRVGDIVRVHLEIEAQTDMTWVVVQDPIPAGSAVLGTGLGRDSSLSTQGERREGWVWPAFEERSFEAFRAYYEYVPKGNWTVEYTVRLSNSGRFQLPTTRVEALYQPELFGEIPNQVFEVEP